MADDRMVALELLRVITPTVSGTLGGAGFYTSDVSVSWAVEDLESAITQQNGCGS